MAVRASLLCAVSSEALLLHRVCFRLSGVAFCSRPSSISPCSGSSPFSPSPDLMFPWSFDLFLRLLAQAKPCHGTFSLYLGIYLCSMFYIKQCNFYCIKMLVMYAAGWSVCLLVQVPYCFRLTLEHFHSDSLESFLLTLEHSRVISALGPLTSSLGCLAKIWLARKYPFAPFLLPDCSVSSTFSTFRS